MVLIAEDETLIQLILREALEDAGFHVISADDGATALKIIDDRHDEMCAFVSDIRLGDGPDGWALARHARELRPDLPIVYMTGDSAADWSAHGVPKSALVPKPFAAAQVITALSTLLNEANTQIG